MTRREYLERHGIETPKHNKYFDEPVDEEFLELLRAIDKMLSQRIEKVN